MPKPKTTCAKRGPRTGALVLLCGLLLTSGCGTTSEANAERASQRGSSAATPALGVRPHIGIVERVLSPEGIVVINPEEARLTRTLQPGTRLETRSLAYQVTGEVEIGPNPSRRFVSARVLSGSPNAGDLVVEVRDR